MILGFEGAVPSDDEVAAILTVLHAAIEKRAESRPAPSAWRLAALLPDLTIEELRAIAHCGSYVP